MKFQQAVLPLEIEFQSKVYNEYLEMLLKRRKKENHGIYGIFSSQIKENLIIERLNDGFLDLLKFVVNKEIDDYYKNYSFD